MADRAAFAESRERVARNRVVELERKVDELTGKVLSLESDRKTLTRALADCQKLSSSGRPDNGDFSRFFEGSSPAYCG
jgi:hypothetical protein